MKYPRNGLLACAFAAGLSFAAAAPAASLREPTQVDPYTATEAPEWTTLFNRREGWSGADGVYSIPLSGDERPGAGASTKTFILFSDTFVGTVKPNGSRVNTTMVNNTSAMLNGAEPVEGKLTFNVRTDKAGAAQSMVLPNQANFAGQWFWPGDGVVVDGKIYVYALRVKPADTPPFAFASAGSSLLWANASDPAPFLGRYGQKRTPLFTPKNDATGAKETYFGLAVMPMTVESGAPNPDGYLYVYGSRSGQYVKSLVVARVRPELIEDFAAYRFWNGSDWVEGVNKAANVTNQVSAEFSVHPLADGRFMLVHMTDLLGHTVAVRYGQSPVGPWGQDIPVWDCPEIALTPNTYVYGAKAHPHLSTPDELLISYHVNSFDFAENFKKGGVDIYRPRFIKVPLH